MKEVKLQKYPTYKPSGVEWLGEIPEHWEVLANKHIFSLKKDLVGRKSADYVLLSLTLNGVIKRDMENPQGKFPAEFNTYQEVKRGDFIFCLFDVEETPRTVGLSDFDGMITGAYTVMRPNDTFDKSFLYYFYLNLDADKRMKPLYTGLRNTITKDNFFSFKTFVPPIAEQTAIANFLDDKTAQIENAIAIKQKQIELLKERRQILIHRAVTRGIGSLSGAETPDVKLKDSGVEWIGEIPEHWEVKRLKYFLFLQRGHDLSKDEFKTGIVPVYGSNGIIGYHNKITTKAPCITIGRSGSVGSLNYVEQDFWAHNTSLYVKESYGNNWKFIYNLLSCIDIKTISNGSAVPTLDRKNVHQTLVVAPNIIEQNQIVEYIEAISQKISIAISLKEKEIEKLKEYKSVLINEAVSGKIKVG